MDNLVLVYGARLNLGGTDTLLVRTANAAVAAGKTVFINSDPGPLAGLLDARAIRPDAGDFGQFFEAVAARSQGEIGILAFDPHTALKFAAYLPRAFEGRTVKVLLGIYHPRELFPDEQYPAMHRTMARIFRRSDPGHWIFMNETCRAAHALHLETDLAAYRIAPILVGRDAAPSWQPSGDACLRIVSVGRVVAQKAYNTGAPQIVARARAAGLAIRWDIYGEGAELEPLRQAAREAGVDDLLTYHGALPYHAMAETLRRHDLFIGMGTALLEAAMLGMPALVAIDKFADRTYGFLDQAPSDTIGEVVPGAPTQPALEMIARYAAMDGDARLALGGACRASALSRSSGAEYVEGLFGGAAIATRESFGAAMRESARFERVARARQAWRRLRGRDPIERF